MAIGVTKGAEATEAEIKKSLYAEGPPDKTTRRPALRTTGAYVTP